MVVAQFTTQSLLSPLLDTGYSTSAEGRRLLLNQMMASISANTHAFAASIGETLGLVHNLAPLVAPAFGRTEFRADVNAREIVYKINATLDQIAAGYDNIRIVEEDRLALSFGSPTLFDEMHYPYSHHGGSVDVNVDEPHQLRFLSEALAREYLDLYESHYSIGRVKCIIIDLDGTLWPGIAAEDGFSWVDEDTTTRWLYFGVHQALKVLKARGVLFASCSKGTEAETISRWAECANRSLLQPDDFVIHQIGWDRKSKAIQEILDKLGFDAADCLFIDDNPVEIDEVTLVHDRLRARRAQLENLRQFLLTSPWFDSSDPSIGKVDRTATTRVSIRNAESKRNVASGSESDFLRSLQVSLTVKRFDADDKLRSFELMSRTSQFNSTGLKLSTEELIRISGKTDSGVAMLRVADKHIDYGLVGICVIDDAVITLLSLSCRVIGLDVALPFIRASVDLAGLQNRSVSVAFVRTPRNGPVEAFLNSHDFRQANDSIFELQGPMGPIDAIHRVKIIYPRSAV